MRKIGLCIAYDGTNYGQLLQAYATQQIIDAMGYKTEIIKYHSGCNKGIKLSYGSIVVGMKSAFQFIKKSICRWNGKVIDSVHTENIASRKEASDTFRKERLRNYVSCEGIDELKERSKSYFAVLVGSDQLWLPDIAVSNFYTLRFAAPGVRRISYATSLGVSSYPKYIRKSAKEFWRDIDFLSVREEQGKKIIQSIIDIPVEVVADPTYLLEKEEWDRLIPCKEVVSKGYVLCYFLGNDINQKRFAKRFAREKKLRIVSLLSNECNSDDFIYADEVLIGKSPEEFVNLIRFSDFILTDSFHGLAFSVINKKQFLVFYRKRIDVKEPRNSRIDNIISSWHIEDRLVRDPKSYRFPEREIDYSVVSKYVETLRGQSLEFLRNALEIGEQL